jgi:hypothetical protein
MPYADPRLRREVELAYHNKRNVERRARGECTDCPVDDIQRAVRGGRCKKHAERLDERRRARRAQGSKD